jgi:hypothetical protein
MRTVLSQNVIGNLVYAIMPIRLDIIEAMRVLSQIVAKFKQAHWVARELIFHCFKIITEFNFCAF